MADRIAIMKAGMVEQIGTPQEIYDRPRTMFVADFIGAPPMNLLNLETAVHRGDRRLALDGGAIEVPEIQEDRPAGPLALGVRPEHVSLADAAALRGRVFGTEYLGTMQIVTIVTAYGQVKARLSSKITVQRGETVGLALQPDRLDRAEPLADLDERNLSHGTPHYKAPTAGLDRLPRRTGRAGPVAGRAPRSRPAELRS